MQGVSAISLIAQTNPRPHFHCPQPMRNIVSPLSFVRPPAPCAYRVVTRVGLQTATSGEQKHAHVSLWGVVLPWASPHSMRDFLRSIVRTSSCALHSLTAVLLRSMSPCVLTARLAPLPTTSYLRILFVEKKTVMSSNSFKFILWISASS